MTNEETINKLIKDTWGDKTKLTNKLIAVLDSKDHQHQQELDKKNQEFIKDLKYIQQACDDERTARYIYFRVKGIIVRYSHPNKEQETDL